MSDVTRILNAIEGGDPKAADELLPLASKISRYAEAKKGKWGSFRGLDLALR